MINPKRSAGLGSGVGLNESNPTVLDRMVELLAEGDRRDWSDEDLLLPLLEFVQGDTRTRVTGRQLHDVLGLRTFVQFSSGIFSTQKERGQLLALFLHELRASSPRMVHPIKGSLKAETFDWENFFDNEASLDRLSPIRRERQVVDQWVRIMGCFARAACRFWARSPQAGSAISSYMYSLSEVLTPVKVARLEYEIQRELLQSNRLVFVNRQRMRRTVPILVGGPGRPVVKSLGQPAFLRPVVGAAR